MAEANALLGLLSFPLKDLQEAAHRQCQLQCSMSIQTARKLQRSKVHSSSWFHPALICSNANQKPLLKRNNKSCRHALAAKPGDSSVITSHGTDSDELQGIFCRWDSSSDHGSLHFQRFSWRDLASDFQVSCMKTSSWTVGATLTASNQP